MMHITQNYGSIIFHRTNGNRRKMLEYMTKSIKLQDDQKNYGFIFNFKRKEKILEIVKLQITSENQAQFAKQYLWLGNTPDVTNRFITTNKINRYLDPGKPNTLVQLTNSLPDGVLKDSLKDVLSIFYPEENDSLIVMEFLEEYNSYLENALLLMQNYQQTSTKRSKTEFQKKVLSVIPIITKKDLDKFVEDISSVTDLKKRLDSFYPENPNEKVKTQINLMSAILGINLEKNVQLISTQIDGISLVDHEDYQKFLYFAIFDQSKEKKEKKSILVHPMSCSLCGRFDSSISTEYLKKSKIKFFMTNKDIFASGLEKKFENNFSLCHQCFTELVLGEKLLLSHFKFYWAGRNMMILPEITPIEGLTFKNLDEIEYNTKNINDQMYKFNEQRDFEKNLEELIELIGFRSLVFHYIYYTMDNGGRPNKIIKIIKDIPPTRIREILRVIQEICSENVIKNEKINGIDLSNIYYTIPVKVDKKNIPKGKSYTHTIYNAIFTKKQLKSHQVIEKFGKAIHHFFYNTPGYNISQPKSQYNLLKMNEKILIMNTIVEFLEKIQSLPCSIHVPKRLINMTKNNAFPLWEEIEKYWAEKSVYNVNEARALFLLGILVADAGSAQYKKLKSEPILKKIQFNGMKRDRLIQLLNGVIDRLIKYKVYQYDSKIHAYIQEYIDRVNPTEWSLSPSENIFYLMSGYSFKHEYIKRFGKKESKNNFNESNSDESEPLEN